MMTMNKDRTEAAAAAIICCLFGMAAVISAAAAASNAVSMMMPAGGEMPAVCNGTIAECQADQEEFLMESEISRRFLQDGKSIGYGALHQNQPVCSPGQGKSYGGNCLPPPSNQPSRGCNAYDRCRTGGG